MMDSPILDASGPFDRDSLQFTEIFFLVENMKNYPEG